MMCILHWLKWLNYFHCVHREAFSVYYLEIGAMQYHRNTEYFVVTLFSFLFPFSHFRTMNTSLSEQQSNFR